ncbi:PPE domain-containing protein [Amycolatopsis suaedae]|uniref:PPE domain-containing protein n=1 Tax=Amycolatopsis suaedae TaxID=2510978 RepID=UPI001F0D859C|nr:hypothetical protein [Amycolatopsis suaedae]
MVDIPAMVERLRTHRFDGYTNEMLATEIQAFRTGRGSDSVGDAVEALRAVAKELSNTDRTLREELAKLGVDWTSGAGTRAGAVLTEHAGFSDAANDRVNRSAGLLFAQGEAFTRTLHKLPDAQQLLAGSGELTLGDEIMSLIGYETDHVKAVKASREARQQAIGALNEYAQESGQHLSESQSIDQPDMMRMVGDSESSTQAAGAAVKVDPVPDVPVTGGKGTVPASVPAGPVGGYDPPTPPMGFPRPGTGAGVPDTTTPSGTAPPSSSPPPAAPPPQTGVVGPVPGTRPSDPPAARPSPAPSPGTTGPGGLVVPPTGAGTGPGGQSGQPARPGTPGFVPGKTGVTPGVPAPGGTSGAPFGKIPATGGDAGFGKVAGGGGADGLLGKQGGDEALGKGRVMGAGPQAPASGPVSGAGFTNVPRPAGGVGDFAAGAAALGAGGVAGAVSGDDERRGRGVGRSAPGAGRPGAGRVPIGDLPEEELRALRNADKLGDREGRRGANYLEKAAPQDGDEDADHVRRYGIDDQDLFSDQRMVSPDVIGDHGGEQR